MNKNRISIPVKQITSDADNRILVGQIPADALQTLEAETEFSHRHDCHFFALHEKGKIEMEIDFERYDTDKPSIVYINPNQVHRTFKAESDVIGYILAIGNENINPIYLRLLEEISPVAPLQLNTENFTNIRKVMLLCINFFERKKDRLYYALLKDICNTLIALIISQYLDTLKSSGKISRSENITKAFKAALERDFITHKRPADYANRLHISVAYLNDCVRSITGWSVTHHIQQHVILEAKRLLYHSDNSVKEIATALGYDDYPYFSRLFTKVAGMTPFAFRSKKHD